MSGAVAPPNADDGLGPIKRVKTAEGENEGKLSAWSQKAKAELETLAKDAEELVSRARTGAEKERDQRLQGARDEADREAERLLTEGRDRASRIRGKKPAELAPLSDPILDAVLGEFRSSGKRSGS